MVEPSKRYRVIPVMLRSIWLRMCIVIVDTNNIKDIMFSPMLAATYAVVDPELTYSVPKNTTIHTGLDVLSHALEARIAAPFAISMELPPPATITRSHFSALQRAPHLSTVATLGSGSTSVNATADAPASSTEVIISFAIPSLYTVGSHTSNTFFIFYNANKFP